MDGLTTVFGPSLVETEQIIVAILLSFVLSMAIATVYRWTFRGVSYSRGFVHALVLASLVTAILIMAIGNNLARGLGILGTLAIIRFRTQLRDPRDIIFMFACLAMGIACGAGVFNVAIVGTVCFCLAALFLSWSPFGSMREYEGLLRFVLPPKSPGESRIKELFDRYCSSAQLVAMREAAQGERLEYAYQVRLLDPSHKPDLLDGLCSIEGVSDASLVMQRSTVEL